MERLRIKMCVEEGRYEEALQVSVDWTVADINRAHIRMLAKHRGSVGTRELINRAKGKILNETDLERGRRFSRIGFKERAVRLLSEALEKCDIGDADDYLLLGQLSEQLRPPEQALIYFEKAAALRGDAGDRLWLGALLERLSRNTDALAQYEAAARQRGSSEDFLAWGRLLYRLKRFDSAEKVLLKARDMGDDGSAAQLLSAIRTVRGRARIKRLLSGIAALWNRPPEKKRTGPTAKISKDAPKEGAG